MPRYDNFADDYYVNASLHTELDLPTSRETLLHFFEQVKKQYPTMRNLYSRERTEFVLEEEKDNGAYRWASVDGRRVASGFVNPPSLESAIELQSFVLDLIPYSLSVSQLDCELFNLMFGFDFSYRGNHHQLIADSLGLAPAFEGIPGIPGCKLLTADQSMTLALDEPCRTQCRIQIEPRSSAFHIRTGEFVDENLSVFVTIRRYGSLESDQSFVDLLNDLYRVGTGILDNYVVGQILQPLQQAIAIK